ncbi:10362_t:CDS:2 [Entrophospora sp. SA101]|nr:10362_t:CDS:2 [Entrophospora sp. SA101]
MLYVSPKRLLLSISNSMLGLDPINPRPRLGESIVINSKDDDSTSLLLCDELEDLDLNIESDFCPNILFGIDETISFVFNYNNVLEKVIV